MPWRTVEQFYRKLSIFVVFAAIQNHMDGVDLQVARQLMDKISKLRKQRSRNHASLKAKEAAITKPRKSLAKELVQSQS